MAGGGSGPGGRSEFKAVVEVEGVAHTADMLARMGARAYNTLPLTEQLAEFLAASQRQRVEEAPWAPLTDDTVARKASQGEDTGILKDEWRPIGGTPTRRGNALYNALTTDGAPGQIKRATRTWAIFGVDTKGDLFYARFVQNVKGTKRRILAISAADGLAIVEKVANYVTHGAL